MSSMKKSTSVSAAKSAAEKKRRSHQTGSHKHVGHKGKSGHRGKRLSQMSDLRYDA